MKLFLCCPISCDPLYRQSMENVEQRLAAAGYTVVNPLKAFKPGLRRAVNLKRILRLMLGCHALALSGNYRNSPTCQFMLDIAFALEFRIASACLWIRRKQSIRVPGSRAETKGDSI